MGKLYGEVLREARLMKGLTREELGRAAGITASTVAQIERGTIMRPPRHRLEGFERALGWSVERQNDAIHVDELRAGK